MNQEPCTVSDLPGMTFDKHIHPRAFYDRALEVAVDNWADLAEQFVAWLAREQHLTRSKLPIHNYAGQGRYFINSEARHGVPHMDGDWRKVGEFYVDTKYNASAHIKNILATLEQLNLRDPHFYLAFRTDDASGR